MVVQMNRSLVVILEEVFAAKTSFCHSTPYMRALADERSSHEKQKTKMTQLMEETGGLRKELDELKQTLSQGGDADAVTHLSWEFFSGSK